MKLIILLTLLILSTSCNSQEKKVNTNKESVFYSLFLRPQNVFS
jgi:hypothetical protein